MVGVWRQQGQGRCLGSGSRSSLSGAVPGSQGRGLPVGGGLAAAAQAWGRCPGYTVWPPGAASGALETRLPDNALTLPEEAATHSAQRRAVPRSPVPSLPSCPVFR